MRIDRLRTRGVALILTMVLVVVVGAGGGLAVTEVGPPADTQPLSFQTDNATGDESDGGSTAESDADSETQTATDTPTPEPEATDEGNVESEGDGDVAAAEETETATETRTATDTPTSTPETTESASASEESESDEGSTPTETDTSNESNASAEGEITTCTEIDEPGEYELAADVEGSGGTCIAVQSSDVVLDGNGHTVAGSGSGTGIQVAGGTSDVTVRNVDVTDWGVAVALGGSGASGPQANLVEVRATDSDTGVRLTEADGSAMQAVTARDNGDGIVLVDTADVQASDLTVDGNDGTGLWLARGVSDSSFSIVQATSNGDQGIHVATGAVDNFIGDATVTDNGGPGVEFADSSDNVLADSRVEGNDGPGVLSYPAGGDRLENVELSGNGDGAYRDQAERAGAVADTVKLRDGTSVQFDQGVTHLAYAGSTESLPDGTDAAGSAVDVTMRDGGDATATVTVPIEASGDVTAYQRVDGNWEEISGTTVADGEAEIPVSQSGVVVPVVESSDAESTESGTDGDTVRADTSSAESTSSDESTSGEEPAANGESAADDGSSAGEEPPTSASEEQSKAADDEPATGQSTDADASDSEAAGEQYAVGGGQAPDGGIADLSAVQADEDAQTVVIGPATADAAIEYTLLVDGNVSKVTDGDVTADANDSISRTNGMVTIRGTTAEADAYVVDGDLRQVRETRGTPGYFLRYGATIGGNETQP